MYPTIHSFDSLPSTNKKAFEIAENKGKHGEVIRARVQTEGRGRLGKSWESPAGKGLYFSIILRPEHLPLSDYPQITLTAGLAVANVLQRISNIETFLKWPNDVYLSGKKCCGILAECSLSNDSGSQFVILGIGVNVNTGREHLPDSIRDMATSLYIETKKETDLDHLLSMIFEEVMLQLQRLEKNGFLAILKEWKKKDFLYGKWLEWVTNEGKVILGRSEGPESNGGMRVRGKDGVLHQVISGDITLAAATPPSR